MYPWLQPVWQEWLAQTMQSQSGGQDYGIGHAYLLAGTKVSALAILLVTFRKGYFVSNQTDNRYWNLAGNARNAINSLNRRILIFFR